MEIRGRVLLTDEQISNPFHVNFHVGRFHEVFDIGRARHDALENLFRDSRNDTLQLVIVDIRTLKERVLWMSGDGDFALLLIPREAQERRRGAASTNLFECE